MIYHLYFATGLGIVAGITACHINIDTFWCFMSGAVFGITVEAAMKSARDRELRLSKHQ